jgi:hypothetical protein
MASWSSRRRPAAAIPDPAAWSAPRLLAQPGAKPAASAEVRVRGAIWWTGCCAPGAATADAQRALIRSDQEHGWTRHLAGIEMALADDGTGYRQPPSLSIEYTLVTLDGVFEDPQIRAPRDALAGRARQPGHHRRPRYPAPLGQRDRLLEAGRVDQPAGWRRRPHRVARSRTGWAGSTMRSPMPAKKPAHAALAALLVPGTPAAGWW